MRWTPFPAPTSKAPLIHLSGGHQTIPRGFTGLVGYAYMLRAVSIEGLHQLCTSNKCIDWEVLAERSPGKPKAAAPAPTTKRPRRSPPGRHWHRLPSPPPAEIRQRKRSIL